MYLYSTDIQKPAQKHFTQMDVIALATMVCIQYGLRQILIE